MAEFILSSVEDPAFELCAQSLETAASKVEVEYPCDDADTIEVIIERE